MRLVVFSDTHTHHRKLVLPDGDVLIGCGDYSYQGEREVLLDFINWLIQNILHILQIYMRD